MVLPFIYQLSIVCRFCTLKQSIKLLLLSCVCIYDQDIPKMYKHGVKMILYHFEIRTYEFLKY